MEFNEALQKSLKADKHTRTDSFLLHSRVSDLVGNDYEAKKAAEQFYRLDAKYEISKTILGSAPMRYKKRKKHYYKIKPMPIPPDDAYVYRSYGSKVFHLSSECPCIKESPFLMRDTYEWAKIRLHRSQNKYDPEFTADGKKIKDPPIRICRRCGSFAPRIANRLVRLVFKLLYECLDIEPNEKMISLYNRRILF